MGIQLLAADSSREYGFYGKVTEKQIKDAIEYWKTIAERDVVTMLGLFKLKRYPESLFFGHIVLEKILKARVVQTIQEQPPYTHDLVRLANLAQTNSNKNEIEFLKIVNDFNIRTRYPEEKLRIYKKYGEKNTKEVLDKILIIYKRLCQKKK